MADVLDEDKGELEVVEEQIAEKPADKLSDDPTYRGKAIEDVIRMHQEAKKVIDRQASEVGEVRKLADELIKSQLYKEPVKTEKPVEVDFFENPQEAVRRAVSEHPDVLSAKQQAQLTRMGMAKQQMDKLHPDRMEIVQSPEFQAYVNASPVRQRLYQAADNYDVEAGNELLTTFKELKAARTKVMSDGEKTARDKTLQSASVDSGGSGESSKKIYKRSALIQLRLRDPNAFAARRAEIEQAYADGRVR
jgi:hypothetical protein